MVLGVDSSVRHLMAVAHRQERQLHWAWRLFFFSPQSEELSFSTHIALVLSLATQPRALTRSGSTSDVHSDANLDCFRGLERLPPRRRPPRKGKIQTPPGTRASSVSRATGAIMDWRPRLKEQFTQLRRRHGMWLGVLSIYPSKRAVPSVRTLCVSDAEFPKWRESAWMTKESPKLAGVGVASHAPRGRRTAVQKSPILSPRPPRTPGGWVVAGPHIMVTTPNTASLTAHPGIPAGGIPWVMWKGTLHAHHGCQ